MATDDLPELCVPDGSAWRAWLQEHHDQPDGVWLVLAKKGTTDPTSLRYDDALDEALSFGWIDAQVRGGTGGVYRQRFTPRRARSPWSKRNVDHVQRLVAERRMHPAGLAEVERAKADGRWEAAYAPQRTAEACAAALEHHRDSAELAYLHALLLAHGGHFVARTEDFGRIVYTLVEVGLLVTQPGDRESDFAGVYDFHEAFRSEYQWEGIPES